MNQDIITSLKNAVEHGESLQTAIQVMINSGYNPAEVQEASQFVAQGVIPQLQPNSTEEFTTPNENSFFKKINPFKKKTQQLQPPQQTAIPLPMPTQQPLPSRRQIQSLPNQQLPMQPINRHHIQKIQPRKRGYLKEIILLIILLILMGVLISIIIFRDDILRFFSG